MVVVLSTWRDVYQDPMAKYHRACKYSDIKGNIRAFAAMEDGVMLIIVTTRWR